MLTVERVRDALQSGDPRTAVARPPRSRAAVAIVLAGSEPSPSMCFLQRVERRGDRWSGDIALPGGWAKAEELRLRDTAMRETREEVGLILDDAHHVGDVPPLGISRHGPDDGIIGASVFYLGRAFPVLEPEVGEVADAFWVRCDDLYEPANRTTVHWSRSGPPQPRPGVDVDGRVIWGLTYRVLVRFSNLVLGPESPLQPDAEQGHAVPR